ncbi:unnamed protein product [Ceutorhynchus assimilis]|uniref:Nucleolar protein 14 n=1 Tax=Ceutorhynchus assimilis TaxID=467358 RepID=A0A9N9N2T0_9CUCU|nr:unnamed protein product [Ceutorhynchus assimilis]
MGKVKNKKRVSVDAIQKKRQNQNAKKQLNPFEVHINKEKMRVLGKKVKNEMGLPGISRAKAIKKRKHTLLNEYKLQHKSNKFMDKRIAERDNVPYEDKIMARFAAVRAKAHSKKMIFNLAEDEVLTHRGQTLNEIEKFDDPRSDNEDSDEEHKSGNLLSTFVKDAHFGGGSSGKEVKTHKQLMDQLIEESKKRKAEKQKIKEATVELTDKLDTEWKDLVQLVSKTNKKETNEEKPNLDDYDKVMRELKFEARGTVSDRLKSEPEIAKEEKEKLEKLEQERLERMRGFAENNPQKITHRSADDLDDNFVYESDTEENMLTYGDDGKSNVEVRAELNGKTIGGNSDIEDENNDTNTDDDSSQNDSEEEDPLLDLKEDDTSSEEDDVETEKSTNSNKDIGIKITSKEVDSAEDDYKTDETSTEVNKSSQKRKLEDIVECNKPKQPKNEENIEDKNELEKLELPFVFSLPEDYDSLMETLQNQSIICQKVILERMIKCNHPTLSQGNKAGLGLLFDYMLRYINDLFANSEDSKTFKKNCKLLSTIIPHIFELAQLNKENAHNSFVEVIKELHQEYRKKKKQYPGIEILIFLKMVSLFFSTSDFRHQVVTPCFVFMEEMLKHCSVKSVKDLCCGLFLCTLVAEFTALSKRFLPATINFLAGIFCMAIPKNDVKPIKVPLTFKSLSKDLVLTSDYSKKKIETKFDISNLFEEEFTDELKVDIMLLALRLLSDFKENCKELPSKSELFTEADKYLKLVPMKNYPKVVQEDYRKLFSDTLSEISYLRWEAKKPKSLRLYEPKIVEVYDGKRRKIQSREKTERDKLLHKLKKETKGAVREIRKDKAFLGRIKINQKIRSDKERRDRVNKIVAEAANQQSELNAFDRQKKKKK